MESIAIVFGSDCGGLCVLFSQIMVYFRQSEHTARLADRFIHKYLKVVKLIGFTGCTSDFELASHLLEIGGSLEEVILQPTYDDLHYEISQMPLIRKQIKQLEAKLPPGVKLMML